MKVRTENFVDRAGEELKNRKTRALLNTIYGIARETRKNIMETFPDPAAALETGRVIRAETIARLPELLEEFERNATANGAVVLWARDAKEANELVLELARERDIEYVTKGKSMVTEEMGLNEVLADNGIEVFETDLGEFIIQQLERPPFHIVGPAINIPPEEISDIFMKTADMKEPTTDPIELGAAARKFLRDKFHHLRMGITGVNMAVAETGTIINVENEGNIRFNKSSPRTQVSIMTIEKVIPTMRDAMHVVRLLCRNCTGQKLSAYVSMDSGPKKKDELDGPEELFIIIIDNGRSDFYADIKARESLRCIRCGACMYACPIYIRIGGYPYGWAYSGPMGQVLNPLLLGREKTRDLYRACTLCGECKVICPGGIDHPKMILAHRSANTESVNTESEPGKKRQRRPWMETIPMSGFGWAAKKRWRWNLGVSGLRRFVNKHAERGVVKKMKGHLEGWFRSRDLPAVPEKTLNERLRKK